MPTQTSESQSKITPDQALLFLKEGNERFRQGVSRKREAKVAGNVINQDILGSLEFVNAVARRNVVVMVEQVRTYSNVLRSLEAEEKIKIVGAMYDISTGTVEFLNETLN